MIKEPHWKVHYRMRMPQIWSWIVQVTPKDLTIKYHTEGSACWIENVRLDRLKIGLNLDKIEDDIEEDREGMSKDKKDEKFLIKTVPNCNKDWCSIFGPCIKQVLLLYKKHQTYVELLHRTFRTRRRQTSILEADAQPKKWFQTTNTFWQ